jgi:hypothetical protein
VSFEETSPDRHLLPYSFLPALHAVCKLLKASFNPKLNRKHIRNTVMELAKILDKPELWSHTERVIKKETA